MKSYLGNAQTVLTFLKKAGKSKTEYVLHSSCYNKLEVYLRQKGLSFSYETSLGWLETLTMHEGTMKVYRKAITRLNDVYICGHVRFNHVNGMILPREFQKAISCFLDEMSLCSAESHVENMRNRCRYFARYLQIEKNILATGKISYQDILDFYRDALCSLSKANKSMYKGTIRQFLEWMAGNGLCTVGFSMILSYNWAEKLLILEDIPDSFRGRLMKMGKNSFGSFPPASFLESSRKFNHELKKLRYGKTVTVSAKTTLSLLFLFLDMNDFGYTPEIGSIWFDSAFHVFGTNAPMLRRILMLFAGYIQKGAIIGPNHPFSYKPRMFDSIPEWCKPVLRAFLEQKKREGKKASTIDMYNSANVRFCMYLGSRGLTDFSQLTAGVIKDFNEQDYHLTAEGKNAYNVRIRKFIFYLADNGYIQNYFLMDAIPCQKASKVRVVQPLSDEQYAQAEKYGRDSDQALTKRNRTILLLGLKMGLRSSDIVSLKLDQVDWRHSSIRFIQNKTDVEKILPMPVDVGNALYIYITTARPASESRYIFLTDKAPYLEVTRSVCRNIFYSAINDWNVPGTAFHATRKTFATRLFRKGVGYSEVADLLGHTNTDTVYKYVSLDEERMRLCPLSLADSGILMKGGFLNEL